MEEYEVIRIPVSDGTEKEFAIMDTFTVEEKHYMAVSLIEEDEIQEGVYLYRYRDAEDGAYALPISPIVWMRSFSSTTASSYFFFVS